MYGKMSFVFDLLIAIVVFSSTSKGGSFGTCDGTLGIMKDIFSGNFNVPVADRTRLQSVRM